MSVHAGAERNVCIIKVSAKTPQSTTNPSQAAPHVQTSTLTPGNEAEKEARFYSKVTIILRHYFSKDPKHYLILKTPAK